MYNPGRILYPVSFDAIEAAVSWQVAECSKALRWPVVLMATRRRRLWSVGATTRPELKRRLMEVAERLRSLRCAVAGVKVADGLPGEQVPQVARTIGARLIMLGAGETSLRKPVHTDATALALARHAPQDVWIARPYADPHLDHVLCAVDTGRSAAAALAEAVDLCRRFNARLRVLSVLPEPGLPGMAEHDDCEIEKRLQEQRAFFKAQDLEGVPLSSEILWAQDASSEVLMEAERYSDGLLVIGASSQSRPPHGTLGITSERILRECPSSLLIVKSARRRPQAAYATLAESVGSR